MPIQRPLPPIIRDGGPRGPHDPLFPHGGGLPPVVRPIKLRDTGDGSDVPGDPFGTPKDSRDKSSPSPSVVARFHARADTDSSQLATHHTLGPKHDQAVAGDHKHDGVSSRRLMEGAVLTGAKGGNVALANLITELADAFGFTDNTT